MKNNIYVTARIIMNLYFFLPYNKRDLLPQTFSNHQKN